MRIALYTIAGLALNWAVLCLPLALLGSWDQAWRHPTIATFFILATAMMAAELFALRAGGRNAKSPAPADRWPLRLAACTGLCLLAIFWLALAENAPTHTLRTHPALALAGGLLMALGVSLRFAAIRSLGRHFVSEIVVRPDQPLVRGGLYRFVRHPSETGLLAISLGACILLAAPLAAVLWLTVMPPLVLGRVALEDRQLRIAFGRAFEAYCRRTKRLVPYVY